MKNKKHNLDDIKKVINDFVKALNKKDIYLMEGQINLFLGELESFKIVDDHNSEIIVWRDEGEWRIEYPKDIESPGISSMFHRISMDIRY